MPPDPSARSASRSATRCWHRSTSFEPLRAASPRRGRARRSGIPRTSGRRNRNSASGETKRARSPSCSGGSLARPPGQQRQGAPDLPFEMQHAVDKIVEERAQCAVDVGLLAARVAIRARQRCAAIEAIRLVGVAVGLARVRLDGAGRSRLRSPHRPAPRDHPSGSPFGPILGAPRMCVLAVRSSWPASVSSAARLTPRTAGTGGSASTRCSVLGLDEVWWLVSPGNPLKRQARDMAPFGARLASAQRLARRARIPDRLRANRRHALYHRHRPAPEAPPSAASLHLANGGGYAARFSQME